MARSTLNAMPTDCRSASARPCAPSRPPHGGLGGHVYHCAACDETRYSYHSCRNRHCPQCQHAAAQQWLREQQALLLPVPYFLLTFTLPAALRRVAQQQPRLIYNLLFRASAVAAQELARDPRFIGGQLGLIGILQPGPAT